MIKEVLIVSSLIKFLCLWTQAIEQEIIGNQTKI